MIIISVRLVIKDEEPIMSFTKYGMKHTTTLLHTYSIYQESKNIIPSHFPELGINPELHAHSLSTQLESDVPEQLSSEEHGLPRTAKNRKKGKVTLWPKL